MKKKTIIISFLLIIIVAFAIPVAGFLFLVFFPLEPETKGKIFEAMKIIDLKKLPKGRFQKVNIVTPISGQILFEIPSDKMGEFEANFRKCVQSAISSKGVSGCIPVAALRIQTDKGKYFAYIDCDDYGVTIYRSSLFHRGFSSGALRKVFYDAGLKYTSGGPKPPPKRDVNECLEILRQSGLRAAENARRIKEAQKSDPNFPGIKRFEPNG